MKVINAEKLQNVLNILASATASAQDVWIKLDNYRLAMVEVEAKHRLEMEAAESKPVSAGQIRDAKLRTPQVKTGGYVGGPVLMDLGELNKRLGAIEERLDKVDPFLEDHRNTITHQGLVKAYNALVLRLDEIKGRAEIVRGAYVAHMEHLHSEMSVLDDGAVLPAAQGGAQPRPSR